MVFFQSIKNKGQVSIRLLKEIYLKKLLQARKQQIKEDQGVYQKDSHWKIQKKGKKTINLLKFETKIKAFFQYPPELST